MTMKLRKAFNARFLVPITRYRSSAGYYDEYNDWVPGQLSTSKLYARVIAGNKFSQFDEGIARKPTTGGDRTSDYLSVYVTDRFNLVLTDRLGFNGKYYNVLQRSDETHFGFNSFLVERSKDWTPDAG